MKTVLFVTNNTYKVAEFSRLFRPFKIQLEQYKPAYEHGELQDVDMEKIVRAKAISAYQRLHRQLLVDHTGMAMDALGGNLPLGLNALFWESLRGSVCGIAHALKRPQVTLLVYLAFCDGKKVHVRFGECRGTMPKDPQPPRPSFNLDSVFIPKNETRTLAQLKPHEREHLPDYYRKNAAIAMGPVLQRLTRKP